MTIAYNTYITERTRIDGLFTQALAIESNYPIIEMNISCIDLPKHDLMAKHDSICVLFTKQNGNYIETDRTEVILNNPNPQYFKSFKTLYIFETYQPLRFEIYNSNSQKSNLKDHDLIGYCETTVQHLVSDLDQEHTFDLEHDKKKGSRGQLVIKCHQTEDSNVQVQGQLEVKNLKKIKTFAKNNPYFEILKPIEDGSEIPVYRSEIKHKCFSCTFQTFSIISQNLCNGNFDNFITIKFYDYTKRRGPILIGSCKNTVNTFIESVGNFNDITSEVTNKKVGEFSFHNIEIVQMPTFLDYLKSGIKLTMVTSIDFSMSTKSTSLHHISKKDPNSMNEYEKCISSVGSILTKYDSSQKFEVYGFGFRHLNSPVCHFFPLTFDENNKSVNGLQGILDVYRNALEAIEFSSPCNLAPTIINVSAQSINSFVHSKTYTILLIVTDGEISDFKETQDAIVDASDSPLSIIIVGVGSGDFTMMKTLDADTCPLVSSKGEKMKRDIVQFVPFGKFKKLSSVSLEQEVLAEIPNQIHQYCETHDYKLNLHKDKL